VTEKLIPLRPLWLCLGQRCGLGQPTDVSSQPPAGGGRPFVGIPRSSPGSGEHRSRQIAVVRPGPLVSKRLWGYSEYVLVYDLLSQVINQG
jgi:hypothetical protein